MVLLLLSLGGPAVASAAQRSVSVREPSLAYEPSPTYGARSGAAPSVRVAAAAGVSSAALPGERQRANANRGAVAHTLAAAPGRSVGHGPPPGVGHGPPPGVGHGPPPGVGHGPPPGVGHGPPPGSATDRPGVGHGPPPGVGHGPPPGVGHGPPPGVGHGPAPVAPKPESQQAPPTPASAPPAPNPAPQTRTLTSSPHTPVATSRPGKGVAVTPVAPSGTRVTKPSPSTRSSRVRVPQLTGTRPSPRNVARVAHATTPVTHQRATPRPLDSRRGAVTDKAPPSHAPLALTLLTGQGLPRLPSHTPFPADPAGSPGAMSAVDAATLFLAGIVMLSPLVALLRRAHRQVTADPARVVAAERLAKATAPKDRRRS